MYGSQAMSESTGEAACRTISQVPASFDRFSQLGIPNRSLRSPRRISLACFVLAVDRRGDRQLPTGRLDPIRLTVFVDEGHHYLGRRSSSDWAK